MIENQESKDVSSLLTDEQVQKWMEEHRTELQQSVSGQRLLYQSLLFGFVVGLVAHIGGYFLLASVPGGLLGLVADLLHALGWSLWTGVVVAVFTQIIPEAKRRQIRDYLKSYEALQRKKVSSVGNRAEAAMKKPPARQPERAQSQKQNRNRPRKNG